MKKEKQEGASLIRLSRDARHSPVTSTSVSIPPHIYPTGEHSRSVARHRHLLTAKACLPNRSCKTFFLRLTRYQDGNNTGDLKLLLTNFKRRPSTLAKKKRGGADPTDLNSNGSDRGASRAYQRRQSVFQQAVFLQWRKKTQQRCGYHPSCGHLATPSHVSRPLKRKTCKRFCKHSRQPRRWKRPEPGSKPVCVSAKDDNADRPRGHLRRRRRRGAPRTQGHLARTPGMQCLSQAEGMCVWYRRLVKQEEG